VERIDDFSKARSIIGVIGPASRDEIGIDSWTIVWDLRSHSREHCILNLVQEVGLDVAIGMFTSEELPKDQAKGVSVALLRKLLLSHDLRCLPRWVRHRPIFSAFFP